MDGKMHTVESRPLIQKCWHLKENQNQSTEKPCHLHHTTHPPTHPQESLGISRLEKRPLAVEAGLGGRAVTVDVN